jgi:hypothetical protein
MSGEKPLFQPQVEGGHEALGSALQQMGLHAEPTSGKYKDPERSYIIHNPTLDQMKQLGKVFGQESIIHSQNGQHRLVYTNGEHEGKYHSAEMQNPIEHFEQPPDDFYTSLPGHGSFRINFDWANMHHLDPVSKSESEVKCTTCGFVQAPEDRAKDSKGCRGGKAHTWPTSTKKTEREFEPELAAYLMKSALAELLADQAPVRHHPHNYEWHDGHSSHHQQDMAAPQQLPGLSKADIGHPHLDGGKPPEAPQPTNDQAAGVGVSTYKQFALPYGNVTPGAKPDLLHYNYHGKLPEISKLVQDHGFKTYYAGGKYGKPDLANKNYNTGHLMVYDPSPSSGGDFGQENYTDGWRQIHELAHALTYPELNKLYGEGRRLGKLGIHRNMNEALRAVHWEWLAAHKQRELSKQIGVHMKDEDFHKELNTVMHDAAHRAVTGKFTEPSGEGFVPHAHKVPLHTALQMVRDSGHQMMGLKGMHDLLPKKGLTKALDWEKPKEVEVAPVKGGVLMTSKVDGKTKLEHHYGGTSETIASTKSPKEAKAKAKEHMEKVEVPGLRSPGLHNSVEGFMSALKAMPKGDPSRGKHITAHMNHGPFLSALQAHPQGKQIHAMLTAHLNSTANAGLKPGSTQVTAKKEKADAIFSKTEGDHPVANEKLYTPEEAREILLKATREKVDAYAKEIEALRGRELKKALIPPSSKDKPGHYASSGVEDVPHGKVNPKGVDKSMGKADAMDKAVDKVVVPTKSTKKPPPPPPGADYTAHKEGTKTVYEAKKAEVEKCGDMKAGDDPTKKAELVDAKGNRKDSHTVSGSKTPDDKKPEHVNKPGKTSKTAGSGGVILPGSKLKKADAAPPTAKPPGKSPAAAAPTSAPKAPKMPAMKAELDKGMTGDMKGGGKPVASPEARSADFSAAMSGAFQPKGPVTSGLQLDKPKAPGAAPAMAKPAAPAGLKSPKAAGVTQSAGPVMNAARPAPAAKPGIFGRLFGGNK